MEIKKKKELEIFREIGVKVAPSGLPLGLFDYCGNRLVLTAACNDKKEENERKKKMDYCSSVCQALHCKNQKI